MQLPRQALCIPLGLGQVSPALLCLRSTNPARGVTGRVDPVVDVDRKQRREAALAAVQKVGNPILEASIRAALEGRIEPFDDPFAKQQQP